MTRITQRAALAVVLSLSALSLTAQSGYAKATGETKSRDADSGAIISPILVTSPVLSVPGSCSLVDTGFPNLFKKTVCALPAGWKEDPAVETAIRNLHEKLRDHCTSGFKGSLIGTPQLKEECSLSANRYRCAIKSKQDCLYHPAPDRAVNRTSGGKRIHGYNEQWYDLSAGGEITAEAGAAR